MTRRIIILVVLVFLTAPLFMRYRAWEQHLGIIPPGVTLAGLAINGRTPTEIDRQLNSLFAAPVAVYYQDHRLILRPQDIGVRIKTRVMIGQARAIGNQLYRGKAFLYSLLNRPLPPRDVPLVLEWDPHRLDEWLTSVAQRYDRPPQPVRARTESFTWQPATPGSRLDKSASGPQIIAALKHVGNDRQVHLVVHPIPPPPPDMKELKRMLNARLKAFPGFGGLFLRLLDTGEEVNIHGSDSAFSGMSTMKIPIMLSVYGKVNGLPEGELRSWMTETVTSTTGAGNYTANRLLSFLGDGDPLRGAQEVTHLLRSLGLKNSFIIAPYDWRHPPPEHVHTPANTHPYVNTYPDPLVQTTPEDIGLVLSMIERCAEGKGTLLAAYPDRFSAAKCRDLLGILAQNPVRNALLPGGLPVGTRYVHKHGYAPDTHGDVALVWGPQGPYVISLFLCTPNEWLVWDISNPTFEAISRLTWEFFALRSR